MTVYDAIPAGRDKGRAFHHEYARLFRSERGATRQQLDDTFARRTYTTDLPTAVRDADLISESVPESIGIKEVGVWDANIGEVMGHPGTDPDVFSRVLTFAEEIGLVPIPIRKEQNGYLINSLLVPWCTAALDLLVRGVRDVESIDRTWMITLQSGIGACGMMDRMGLGARTPRRRERQGLLQLSDSDLRPAGLYLTARRTWPAPARQMRARRSRVLPMAILGV